MNEIFKEVMIWRHLDDTSAIRYSCVNEMATQQYAVQRADFFRLPVDEKQFRSFKKKFVELFIDIPARDPSDWFDSIEEAIEAHEREFHE